MNRLKLFSLFSGIGAFEKALDNLGVPYELVAFCEIDKYASKSYAAIHGVPESMNIGDIMKVDEKKLPKDIDLITYGFPCQDISISGKQKGLFNADGTQTRSGLFFEALRIIEETQPRVAIAENVKNLTSKKFALQFKIVLDSLKAAGYNNYFQVLNAKDYGIPQNRERVFIVSIRKDIDNGGFKFPEAFPLELRLKDMLEDKVDEKYYLSKKMIDYVTAKVEGCGFGGDINPQIARSLTATMTKMHRAGVDNYVSDCIEIANLHHYRNDQMNRVYSVEGCSPTMLTKNGCRTYCESKRSVLARATEHWQKLCVCQSRRLNTGSERILVLQYQMRMYGGSLNQNWKSPQQNLMKQSPHLKKGQVCMRSQNGAILPQVLHRH